ncbi:MAG: bacterioferritin [Chromatiales bacterium]|jgi:bacterioferritin|nr:bacterioferritin [Chromatiales bacterium]
MQGDGQVIRHLNATLKSQLTAINQFFLHARMCGHWGLQSLNEREYKHSIKAMKLADELIARVLFLEGLPNLQDLGKLLIGEDVPEVLGNDLALRKESHAIMVSAVNYCEEVQDYISRDLLVEQIEETEEHIDWLETQLKLIDSVGEQNYLQSMM